MSGTSTKAPLRILIAALGGEGGGVLMNWIVEAARGAGRAVQATSVPGVAQRTGSTTYYIEIAERSGGAAPILSLVPMPGRVDVVVSSELVETARVLAAGFVSPGLTTLISSTARQLTTAEKIEMGDGRYGDANIRAAAEKLAKRALILDLGEIATRHGTFVSATMFGALAGAGVLPWTTDQSRAVLGEGRSAQASLAGFDAALAAVKAGEDAAPGAPAAAADRARSLPGQADLPGDLPEEVRTVIVHGIARCADYQDAAYGRDYRDRALRLAATDLSDHRRVHAVTEACRRLALWMTYEDIARVADLKTRPERFARIRAEAQMAPGQLLTVTEYLKPRAEEIADILPRAWGQRVMARVEAGRGFPLLGRGLRLRSNGVVGFRLLRLMAAFRRIRRRSYRFVAEQAAIEEWLSLTVDALATAPDFAAALAELPRVLKGYSDTLVRGRAAYEAIMEAVVRPAVASGGEGDAAARLRAAIAAALGDDTHGRLREALGGGPVAAAT